MFWQYVHLPNNIEKLTIGNSCLKYYSMIINYIYSLDIFRFPIYKILGSL